MRRADRQPYHLHVLTVSASRNPQGMSRLVMGLLYLLHQLYYAVITSKESAQSHVHIDTVCFCNQSDGAACIRLPT
jgi:hypothetical protein